MNREDLKVGGEYVNDVLNNGLIYTVKYIGKKFLYIEFEEHGRLKEEDYSISEFLNDCSPKPQ